MWQASFCSGQRQRKRHDEFTPLAVAGTPRDDAPAVQVDDLFHDVQSDPETTARILASAFRSSEEIEHSRQHLRRDSNAAVRNP